MFSKFSPAFPKVLFFLFLPFLASGQSIQKASYVGTYQNDLKVEFAGLSEMPNRYDPSQQTTPSWHHFWIFPNGVISREKSPVNVFPTSADEREASIRVKGRYTKDDNPPGNRVGSSILTLNSGPTTSAANTFKLIPSGSTQNVWVESELNAGAPGDELVFPVAIKKPGSLPRSGKLYLMFPPSKMEFVEVLYQNPVFQNDIKKAFLGPVETSGIATSRGVSVPFTFQATSSDEARLLLVFRIKDNGDIASTDMTTTYSVPYFAGIAWEDEQTTTGGSDPSKNFVKWLLGLEDPENYSVVNPSYLNFAETHTQTLQVNRSRDPNGISILPDCVRPKYAGSFKVRVDFENTGASRAKMVSAEIEVDEKLLLPDPKKVEAEPERADRVKNVASAGQKITVTMEGINLPSVNDVANPSSAQVPDPLKRLTMGSVKFDSKVSGQTKLRHGDKVEVNAIIGMDGKYLPRDFASARVSRRAGLRPGCFWGAKTSYNFEEFRDTNFAKGWDVIALTLRCGLGRMPSNYTVEDRRLNVSALPAWWWQSELGIGWSDFRVGQSKNLHTGYLSLCPLQIRWVPKINCKLFKNRRRPIKIGRIFGISAGYWASWYYSAKVDGQDYPMPSDFLKQLDHSVGGSLDFFNILGQPGLSLGGGLKWHVNQITGQELQYFHPFVYAHFNFPACRSRRNSGEYH